MADDVALAERFASWNATGHDYPRESCVHELFEQQVRRTPSATALRDGGTTLSYAELNARANRLARRLVDDGVGSEVRVGICLERSIDSVVALLAVLKAGGAYVPLDPAYPLGRRQAIVDDAEPRVVLTRRGLEGALRLGNAMARYVDEIDLASGPSDDLPRRVSADGTAFVLYTSGSTGAPKGVEGLHRGVVNRVCWEHYPFAAHEVLCHKTSLGFIDSLWEIFSALTRGLCTVVASDATVRDPSAFVRLLADNAVTRLVLVPSFLRALIENVPSLGAQLPALTYWISSGEALTSALARKFYAAVPHGALINIYGLTEVWDVTWHDSRSDVGASFVPIGRLVGNMQAYVLDADRKLVDVDEAGELYVSGDSVARGYFRRATLSAERFVEAPPELGVPSSRLYRTGDLAKYRADGVIEHLGRSDHQVKVRGFRIELPEIEATLAEHPAVSTATVVLREDAHGEKNLVAYVVPSSVPPPDEAELREHVGHKLPPHMVPAHYVALDTLPLLPNGKVDRHSLPPPPQVSAPAGFVEPRTELESGLARLWSEVLGIDRVGVHDDFIALGGDSLKEMRFVRRVREELGHKLSFRDWATDRTIASAAALLEQRRGADLTHAGEAAISDWTWRLLAQRALVPGAGLWNDVLAFTVEGEVDVDRLSAAWHYVCERHDVLRSAYALHPERRPIRIAREDARVEVRVVEDDPKKNRVLEALSYELDLERGPLSRVLLVRRSPRSWDVYWTYHHSILDGASAFAVLENVFDAYAKGRTPADVAGDGHIGFAAEEPTAAEPPAVAFWRDYLRDAHALSAGDLVRYRAQEERSLVRIARERVRSSVAKTSWASSHLAELRTDPSRWPAGPVAAAGALVPSAALKHARAFAESLGVSMSTVLHACFGLLLLRITQREDLVFGLMVLPRELADTSPGNLARPVPLRVRVSPDETVQAWLLRMQRELRAVLDHAFVPTRLFTEELGLASSFQDFLCTNWNYWDSSRIAARAPGLEVSNERTMGTSLSSLVVSTVWNEQLDVTLSADTAVFGADLSAHLVAEYVAAFDWLTNATHETTVASLLARRFNQLPGPRLTPR